MVKNLPASARDVKETQVPSLGQKIPWIRKWQPSPVFLSRKFQAQKSLAGYSPWGPKESYTTERAHTHTHRASVATT